LVSPVSLFDKHAKVLPASSSMKFVSVCQGVITLILYALSIAALRKRFKIQN
jgi:hypothetical protein